MQKLKDYKDLVVVVLIVIVLVLQLILIKQQRNTSINEYVIDSIRVELYKQHSKDLQDTYKTPIDSLAKQIEKWQKSTK